MNLRSVRKALVACCACMLAGSGAVVAAPAQPNGDVLKEIQAMDAKVAAARDKKELGTFQSDKLIDIHASGWKYTKAENIALGNAAGPGVERAKIIKAEKTPIEYEVFNNNAVLETWIITNYYEEPDPQEVARKMGTLLEDAAAENKARKVMQTYPSYGPSEGPAPNPYRSRQVRLWVRENGAWKIGLDQSTRVGLRVHQGWP